MGHVATVVSTPLQPLPHTTPQPTHPGYQFVPAQPGFRGQPNPTGAAGSYVAPSELLQDISTFIQTAKLADASILQLLGIKAVKSKMTVEC